MAAPTDPYELLQYNMIHAHNTFKLGYDIILTHLADPPTADMRNFLGYCEAWARGIESHHSSEEEIVFPFLNTRMDFSGEEEQHKVIHAALDAILALLSDPAAFDAAQAVALMGPLKEPLYAHLDEEVEHISAANLRAAGFEEPELVRLVGELAAYARAHGDPFLLVPFMRSHTPPEHKDTWPSMPWLVRKLVVPYVLAQRHSGYWKYSPYAMS